MSKIIDFSDYLQNLKPAFITSIGVFCGTIEHSNEIEGILEKCYLLSNAKLYNLELSKLINSFESIMLNKEQIIGITSVNEMYSE